jgi:hypothetical protein
MRSSSPPVVRRRISTLVASAALFFNSAFIAAQAPGAKERQAGILFYNEGKTVEAISALRTAVKAGQSGR